MSQGSYVKTAAASAGVLAGALCAYQIYSEVKKSKLPTSWKEVGTLKDIFFYPIKSCGSVQRNTAECTFLGLKDGWLRDRTLMVVDEKNHFVTARIHPKLLLIQPSVNNSVLTLRAKDMEPLEINLEEANNNSEQTNSISNNVEFKVPGVRLWLGGERVVVQGAFADETPFNLINQASIDDLNTRLNELEVTHKNFRSNFILAGAQAYDEDNWKFVKIGENVFEIIKACTRCIMTVNNPETGVRNPNVEPLATLRKYRQHTDPDLRRYCGSTPRMGLQMVLRSNNGGSVSINDTIYVA